MRGAGLSAAGLCAVGVAACVVFQWKPGFHRSSSVYLCVCVLVVQSRLPLRMGILTVFQTQSFMKCAAFIVTLVIFFLFFLCLFVSGGFF